MSALDFVKVIWRWRLLARQVVQDFRYHRNIQGVPGSLLSRFVEQLRLLWSNRIRAVDYYELDLFNPEISSAAKRRYIGQFQTRRLLSVANSGEFHKLTDDKLQFGILAVDAGLPVPEILAVVTRESRTKKIPRLGTVHELQEWMVGNRISDVILKPADGLKGWGVLSLGMQLGSEAVWKTLPGGESIDIGAIWAHCERYLNQGGVLIQRRLQAHPVLAELMPDVLHTVRAVSYLAPEPTIVSTALRVGSGKGPADNLAQGGIMVPIDVASGRCGRGTMLVDGLPQFVDEHPVSGTRMTDVVLPDWQQVHDLVKAAAETFKVQKSIGWDVGLTRRGPVLLEGNWCYDLGVNQIAHRKGILDTPWIEVFNNEDVYRVLSLGFRNQRAERYVG